MSLKAGLFSEQGIGWIAAAGRLLSVALCPIGGWSQVVCLGNGTL